MIDPEEYDYAPPEGVRECDMCGGWFRPEPGDRDQSRCPICAEQGPASA